MTRDAEGDDDRGFEHVGLHMPSLSYDMMLSCNGPSSCYAVVVDWNGLDV